MDDGFMPIVQGVTYLTKADKGFARGAAVAAVMRFILEPVEHWSIDMLQHLLAMDAGCYTD